MEKKDNNPKVEVAKAEINKKTNETKKKVNKTRRIVVLFVLLFFVVITGISLRAEYLNYLEIGETYISVLIQKIQNKYIVLGTVFVTTYIFIYVLNKFIIKGLKKFFDEEKKERLNIQKKSLG